ncbi:MAG: choice-of-anchor D domain-containing protein, partial [Actinomycetota bacterium]
SNVLVALLTSGPAQAATCPAGADMWTGTSGFWGDASNWSLGEPTAGEVACIGAGTVDVSDVSIAAGVVMTGGSMTIQGGTLELTDNTVASTIDNLDFVSGILQADSAPSAPALTVTLEGTSTWSGGTIQGGGSGTLDSQVIVASGATLDLQGSGGAGSSPTLSAGSGLVNDGTIDWSGGNPSGNIVCIYGDGLDNAGTFNISGGGTLTQCIDAPAPVITDEPGALMDISGSNVQFQDDFADNGILKLSTVLAIDDVNFNMGSTSVFEPEIDGALSYGNIQVGLLSSNTPSLAGTIVPTTAAGFIPTAGEVFQIIPCEPACVSTIPSPTTQPEYVVQPDGGGDVNLVAEPFVSLSAASLDFGSVNVGSTSGPLAEVITNIGSAPLSVTSDTLSGTDPTEFSFVSDACTGQMIDPGATCEIDLQFQPTGAGAAAANLVITDDAGDSPQSVGLSGTGVTTAGVSLSPNPVTFPDTQVGATSGSMSVTVLSNGSAALVVSSVDIAGTDPGDFAASNGCSGSINGGESCSIDVTFTPTASGARTATLEVSDNAPGSPQTVVLNGNGIALASNVGVVSSANPSTLGQSVDFTATVGGGSGSQQPTGTLEFQSDGVDIAGCTAVDVN